MSTNVQERIKKLVRTHDRITEEIEHLKQQKADIEFELKGEFIERQDFAALNLNMNYVKRYWS